MKAKPFKREKDLLVACESSEATHVLLTMPGPIRNRLIPIDRWHWNGDTERPTLTPSLLTTTSQGDEDIVCHCFITDGKVQFLSDCNHKYAGQTVDLLDIDEDWLQ